MVVLGSAYKETILYSQTCSWYVIDIEKEIVYMPFPKMICYMDVVIMFYVVVMDCYVRTDHS